MAVIVLPPNSHRRVFLTGKTFETIEHLLPPLDDTTASYSSLLVLCIDRRHSQSQYKVISFFRGPRPDLEQEHTRGDQNRPSLDSSPAMSHIVEHDLDPEELEQLEQEDDVFGELTPS